MKLFLKPITLKEDTLEEINRGNYDVNNFISSINEYLSQANDLLYTKIESLNELELYQKLKPIYNIKLNTNDYLKALSQKYNKHYTNFITIKVNDDNYFVLSTSKYAYLDESTIDLNKFRNLINREELIILNKELIKNEYLDESNELFPYFLEILKKELLVKNILFDLKWYTKEVMHQARTVTDLANNKTNLELAEIGKMYKNALDNCYNEGTITKTKKISVPKHRKIKRN